MTTKGIVRMLLLVAVVAGLIALAANLRRKQEAADAVVENIEGQLAELDPVTRAAAVAQLSADAADHVRASRDGDG
jgi:hypothetical protein